MAYSTGIEGFITEIRKEQFGEIDKIKNITSSMRKDANIIKNNLLVELKKPNMDDLKKNVIAVDGSNYQEQYQSIAITIATAYVYINNMPLERYLPNIKVIPPYYSSLVNSLRMKNLEYRVALEVLQEMKEKEEHIDLVLLDGAMTFPDEAISEYTENVLWVKEAYDEHKIIVNDFYDFVIDNDIPTIAFVKDSMANKYFLSLYQLFKNINIESECDHDFIDKNSEFIQKWGKNGDYNFISENSMLKMIFDSKEFCRSKYTEVTCSLRNPVPADKLKDNVMGFYFKSINSQRPFFIEIPGQFTDRIDDISNILSSLSYFSLRRGYPFPLYAAHKKVELKKKYAKNLALVLKNIAKNDLKEGYDYLFSDEKFHNSM